MRHIQIYLFFSICLTALSCNNKKTPDISKIKLNISIERFDQELNRIRPDDISKQAPALRKKYTWFYDDYMEQMLSVGFAKDTAYYSNLRTVLKNQDYLELRSTVEKTFPDLNKQQDELNQAFRYIRYYFPKQKLPRLISFISGFAVQTPIGNDYIGIGLDMFLGKNGDKFYPALRQSIPHYISRRFSPEYISPRVIETFIREDIFPENDDDRSLLSKMIYNGKVLYFMDAVMPKIADTIKIGYTTEQLQWCRDYESGIWAYFLENELLFETDYMKIQKYLAEAPFTPGIGENSSSAPKLGVWTGWQIVRKYMEKNPDISLRQLMQERDAQKILSSSKYKPRD
ncbi:MAG: gliding motility lipoprotein GldB [Pedobacter sp.]|jgi:gliding motility-associated lipoprotein GldB